MTRSIFMAAVAGIAMIFATLAPAQAAMVSVPGATAPGKAFADSLVQKTQRRGGRRGRRHHRGGRGAAIGAGIAIGVLGAIAASEAAAREDRYEQRCRRWRRQCYDGSDRACWKYDNHC